MSQPDSWEGRTQVRPFFWNQELFIKLGADKSGAQWVASQKLQFSDRRIASREKETYPPLKTNWGEGGETKGWILLEGSYSVIE